MKKATRAVQGGQIADPSTGAIMSPIYQNSTYAQDGPGEHKGYEYSRTQNPTRDAFQRSMASVENGKHGLAYASGMAAIDAIMKLLNPGDEVISTSDLYGGTYRIYTKIFERYGLKFHFTGMNDLDDVEKLITSNTKLIWVETPTNPMLNIIDIKGCADLAKKYNCLFAVDNTFASPYLQRPLDLGADIVMHSVTKYIGGHSDLVLGALVVNDDKLAEELAFIQNSSGGVPGPQDCFLALRGMKTLHVRLQRHCENAEAIAKFLKGKSEVDKVVWPGFEDHQNHDIAKKQMDGFGGMVSFSLKSGRLEDAVTFLKNTKLFICAESLGGVESLIGHPASMTHASIPQEEREKTGVSDTLIRLSVGIEDIDDLVNDLEVAFKSLPVYA